MPSREEKVREVAAAVQHGVSTKLHTIWWAFLLRGLLALGLAACALFWPERTMGLLIKLLGAYFIIDGVAGAVGAFRTKGKGSIPIQAVVSLAAGLTLLFWTDVSAKLFLILIGVWALLQGAGMFLSSRSMDAHDENRGALAIIGAVVAMIGIVFIFWPDKGVVAVSWLIGLGSILVGGLLIFLATRLRRAKQRIDATGK